MTTINKRFTVYFSGPTAQFMNILQLPNRSDYIEELVLTDWATQDCGHSEERKDCAACYARNALKVIKPRKDVSEKSSIQTIRRQFCSDWLTEQLFSRARQVLLNSNYNSRQLVVDEQQAVFSRAPFTFWGVYIAGLTLTLDGQPVFGAKDVRQKLQFLLGNLWDTSGAKAGSVLPGDATEGSKYANGFDCLQIVEPGKRPLYIWQGFRIK